MRNLSANVHDSGRLGHGIKVLRKGLPFPLHAFRKNRAGDIFHAFHELHHPLSLMGVGRRKANATIAHDCGGDAMPRRGRHVGIPADLAVVMRVDINPARRDQQAFCV